MLLDLVLAAIWGMVAPAAEVAASCQDLVCAIQDVTRPEPDSTSSEIPTPKPAPTPEQAPPEGPAEIRPAPKRWRTFDPQGRTEYTFRIYDPYHQNILKADFPLRGNWFVELNAFNNFTYKSRRNLDFSAAFSGEIHDHTLKFVPHNHFVNENILFGAELRRNEDTFVPSNFRFRVNGVADYKNDINAFNDGNNSASHLFDAFVDIQLHDFGKQDKYHSGRQTHEEPNFDLLFLRSGLQGFKSEFHGLIFNDVGLGGRLFGEFKKNRLRYDFAYFKLFQKNAVSGFTEFRNPRSVFEDLSGRHQVLITRFTWEDLVPGWNSEWTFHYNRDHRKIPGASVDRAGVDLDTFYLGASFNGHVGRFTFNPALHTVLGNADFLATASPVRHSVRAWTGLADCQYKLDFWNFRLGYLYASGDGNAQDTRDTGFDAISDGVQLFGGPLSYWVGENIKFGKGDFVRANSLFPSFRGFNDQANHINPGLQAFNAGVDLTLLPRLEFSANLNLLAFAATGAYTIRAGLGNQTKRMAIRQRGVGVEENIFLRWKPFLREANQNVILDAGFSLLTPGQGLQDAFRSGRTVFSTFLAFRLLY